MPGEPRITLRQKISLFAFGIIIALVMVEVSLCLFGFFYLSRQAQRNKISLERWGEFRILCLGESTTALGGRDSYPRQLGRLLRKRMPGKKISMINKAIPGVSTAAILDSLPDNLVEYNPQMVIVMMGINDREEAAISVASEEGFLRWSKDKIKRMRIYNLARFCKRIIQERTALRNIYLERARFYTAMDDDENTERAFEQAINVTPRDPYPYIEFGKYFQEIKEDLKQAEEQFRRALIANPTAYEEYVNFGIYCRQEEKYPEAESIFKNAISSLPVRPQAYTQLGLLYILEDRLEEAEAVLEKEYQDFPKDFQAILALAILYQARGDLASAEKLFLRAVEINPEEEAYVYLSGCLNLEGKYKESEEHLKTALARRPKSMGLYFALSRCYMAQRDLSRAEEVLKKASKIDPMDDETYVEFTLLYQAQKLSAEEILRRVLNIDPGNESLLEELDKYYRNQNKSLESDEVVQNFIQVYKGTDNYLRPTKRRYRELRYMVLARGIPLVCVQYPRRRLQPLKDILGTKGQIIFVNNEKVFNEAVAEGKYEDYFVDRFAGDFGHCTKKGNYLLAENVAEALLREYFHKDK